MSTQVSQQPRGADSLSVGAFISLKGAILGLAGVMGLMVFYRWFQGNYAWTAGLDATMPIFDKVWMGLLSIQLPLIVAAWIGTWSYLWFTRDRHLDKLQPKEEIKRYFTLVLFILVYALAVYFAASFFAEEDAAWHQVAVRDTSFTPSHIVLFYGTMPLYITFGVGSMLYAITRLPKFAANISIPFFLAVAGPLMILPNLGYNEWGHAFWMLEEVFTAPLHWGFVVLGWSVLALGGLLVQIMMHVIELIAKVDKEENLKAA